MFNNLLPASERGPRWILFIIIMCAICSMKPDLAAGQQEAVQSNGGATIDTSGGETEIDKNGLIRFLVTLPNTTVHKSTGQRHLFRCQVTWPLSVTNDDSKSIVGDNGELPMVYIEWFKNGAPLNSSSGSSVVHAITVQQQIAANRSKQHHLSNDDFYQDTNSDNNNNNTSSRYANEILDSDGSATTQASTLEQTTEKTKSVSVSNTTDNNTAALGEEQIPRPAHNNKRSANVAIDRIVSYYTQQQQQQQQQLRYKRHYANPNTQHYNKHHYHNHNHHNHHHHHHHHNHHNPSRALRNNNENKIEIKNILDRNKRKLTSRLRILELNQNDSGQYKCLASILYSSEVSKEKNATLESMGSTLQVEPTTTTKKRRPIQGQNSTIASIASISFTSDSTKDASPLPTLHQHQQLDIQQQLEQQQKQEQSDPPMEPRSIGESAAVSNESGVTQDGLSSGGQFESSLLVDTTEELLLVQDPLTANVTGLDGAGPTPPPDNHTSSLADVTSGNDADQLSDDGLGMMDTNNDNTGEFVGTGPTDQQQLEPTLQNLNNANELQHQQQQRQYNGAPSCQVYQGGACRQHLANKTIYSPDSAYVAQMEDKMSLMLQVIAASQTISVHCHRYAVPMLCYNVFQPCSVDEGQITSKQICRDECEVLEWIMCKNEFELARQHHSIIAAATTTTSSSSAAAAASSSLLPRCSALAEVGTPQGDKCNRLGLYQRATQMIGSSPIAAAAVAAAAASPGGDENQRDTKNQDDLEPLATSQLVPQLHTLGIMRWVTYGPTHNNNNNNKHDTTLAYQHYNNHQHMNGARNFWRALLDGSSGSLPTDRLELHESMGPVAQEHTCFNGLGLSYRGQASVTHDKQVCAHWHQVHDHLNSKPATASSSTNEIQFERHPELFGGHNYCRNPNQLESKPWCYVATTQTQTQTQTMGTTTSQQQYYVRKVCQLQRCFHYFWLYLLAPCVGAITTLIIIFILIVRTVRQKHRKKKKKNKNIPIKARTHQTDVDSNKSTYKLIDVGTDDDYTSIIDSNDKSTTLAGQYLLPAQLKSESTFQQSLGPRFASIKQIYNNNDQQSNTKDANDDLEHSQRMFNAINSFNTADMLSSSNCNNKTTINRCTSTGTKKHPQTHIVQYNVRNLDGQVRCMQMTSVEPTQSDCDISTTGVVVKTNESNTNTLSSSTHTNLSPMQRPFATNNSPHKLFQQQASSCGTAPVGVSDQSATMNEFELNDNNNSLMNGTTTTTTTAAPTLEDIHLMEVLYDGQFSSIYLATVPDNNTIMADNRQQHNYKYLAVRMLKLTQEESSATEQQQSIMKTSKSIFNHNSRQIIDNDDMNIMSLSWAPNDDKPAAAAAAANKEQQLLIGDSFSREAQLLSNNGLNHDNLINFIGILHSSNGDDDDDDDHQCSTSSPILLYDMSNHTVDLTQWLMKRRTMLINYNSCDNNQLAATSSNEFERILNGELLMIGKQIASAMQYLHDNNYIHRDLATRNCFLHSSDSLHVKLGAFNMINEDEQQQANNNGGGDCFVFNDLIRPQYMDNYFKIPSRKSILPLSWMPLESILFSKYSKTSDVWSYGCVLYELFSLGERAYFGYTSKQIIDSIRSHLMPPKPVHCPKKIYDLICKCLADLPNSRPSFKQLSHELEDDNLLSMCYIVKSPTTKMIQPSSSNQMPMSKSIFMMGPRQHLNLDQRQQLKSSISASQFQLQQTKQRPQVPVVYDIPTSYGPPLFPPPPPPPPPPSDSINTTTRKYNNLAQLPNNNDNNNDKEEHEIDKLYKETTSVLAKFKRFQDNDYHYGNIAHVVGQDTDQNNSDNLSLDSTGTINQASSVASSFRPITTLNDYYDNILPKQATPNAIMLQNLNTTAI